MEEWVIHLKRRRHRAAMINLSQKAGLGKNIYYKIKQGKQGKATEVGAGGAK